MRPSATVSYADRTREILWNWALLTGQSTEFTNDPRTAIFITELGYRAPETGAYLCADHSPLEFCERVGGQRQKLALTLEFQISEAVSRLDQFCYVSSTDDTLRVKQAIENRVQDLRAIWIGIDFSLRNGVRLYCDLAEEFAGSLQTNLVSGAPLPFTENCLTQQAAFACSEMSEKGKLRVVGTDIGGERRGSKLAFSHPLDRDSIERIAAACRIRSAPFQVYQEMLSPASGAWRHARSGMALSISEASVVEGLTIYHYTAPFFQADEDLRSFVLQLGRQFSWDTSVYRSTSRLLDVAGQRVRMLLGFTVTAADKTSIRLYGRSGALA